MSVYFQEMDLFSLQTALTDWANTENTEVATNLVTTFMSLAGQEEKVWKLNYWFPTLSGVTISGTPYEYTDILVNFIELYKSGKTYDEAFEEAYQIVIDTVPIE